MWLPQQGPGCSLSAEPGASTHASRAEVPLSDPLLREPRHLSKPAVGKWVPIRIPPQKQAESASTAEVAGAGGVRFIAVRQDARCPRQRTATIGARPTRGLAEGTVYEGPRGRPPKHVTSPFLGARRIQGSHRPPPQDPILLSPGPADPSPGPISSVPHTPSRAVPKVPQIPSSGPHSPSQGSSTTHSPAGLLLPLQPLAPSRGPAPR